ncbi:TPA: tail assembly protein [Klebsiella aerogenes]|nr:tail assembly protein [Klebsiella aerogenes]
MAVKTSAEAVKALSINLAGFESYLMNAKKNGMVFAVFRGKRNIGLDDYKNLEGDSDIRIAPVMEGAKKAGMFQTILGAVLLVVGMVTAIIFPGNPVSPYLIASGASMMTGGIYQMLSPQPKGLQGREDPDNKPSYAFGSAVNSTAMGNPIPVLYGQREIGGAILRAGITAEDI